MKNKTRKKLVALYRKMDTAWNKKAAYYNFQCNGCEDNCCKSLFYHHTFVEKEYLLEGFKKLNTDIKNWVIDLAEKYCDKLLLYGNSQISPKIMCPLNQGGLCLIYDYRPMICRLHGLPHELCKPRAQPVKGPGCNAGKEIFSSKEYVKFDRTPFYQSMASIETEYKKNLHATDRIKQTIAQMLTL